MIKALSSVIAILVICLGLITNTYLNNRDELTKAEQANDSLQLTLDATVSDFKSQGTKLESLNFELDKIQTEKDVAYNKLNEYRSRENVVKKKPKAIERIANAATKRMFIDLCSSTGGNCQDKAANTDTSNTTSNQVSRNNE